MISPKNYLIQTDAALNELITTISGVQLYGAGKYNFEWNVSVIGNLLAKPVVKCFDVTEGDEVAFSYKVVSERKFEVKTDDVFQLAEDNGNNYKAWINNKKFCLSKEKHPYKNEWSGLLINTSYELIDAQVGTESNVDGWLAQFDFVDDSKYTHVNLFENGKEDFWKVQPEYLLAKRDKKGITAFNDYVILKPVYKDITTKFELFSATSAATPIKELYLDRGEVVATGGMSGINKGDIVAFESEYAEKYELWGKNYLLVKHRRVQGVF